MTRNTSSTGMSPEAPDAPPVQQPRRRAWQPEAGAEAAAALRHLNAHCWLVAGRDDAMIATVRRHESALKSAYGRLGWVLIIDRDLVRLRKSPPARPSDYAEAGPNRLTCSWFFLLVAAAESLPPRVAIGQLVNASRSAAAEAGIPATNDITERRAVVAALRMLDERGVIERVDGDLDTFVRDENAPVLLAVHHTRLAHIIANPGTLDPASDPAGWLAQVHREPDAARRMRRALVDDTCVHGALLAEDEAAWLSQRVRADDGEQIAAAFGLTLERRAEGAAFVVPEDAYRYPSELGPAPFPMPGTIPHAALLLMAQAETTGTASGAPGPGWLGITQQEATGALAAFAEENSGSWSAEYTADPAHLAKAVGELLVAINAVRITGAPAADPADRTWWFAPVTGRWGEEGSAQPKSGRHRARLATPAAQPDETPHLDMQEDR